MLSGRRMTGKRRRERRGRNGAGDRRRLRDMNKKTITPPSLLRAALFGLFLGGILAYGAGFAWYMLDRFDLINLIANIHDDAFYYFQIARNLTEGKFSTFDGGITRTNGYHPLWLFLITPFYWIFDKEAALFAIKAFEIMLIAGGVALVTAAARLARLPWYLLFAALPMLYRRSALFSGMEAAAALFMLGLFFLAVMLYARDSQRWQWPLAAVAFGLPWVRLEYAAISLSATAALCLIEWSRRERAPGALLGERARSALSIKAAVPFLAAAAGILAYFAYNGIVFGGIVPVSGATKQMWSQQFWEQEGGYSFVQNFRDALQIPAFDYHLPVALEVCAYVVLLWWFARRSGGRTDRLPAAFLACVFGLAVGHLAKFAQTVLTVHPYWGSDPWYFVPAYLLMTLMIPVRCYVAGCFIRRFLDSRAPRAANLLSAGIVVVGAAFLFTGADFTGPFRFVDRSSKSTRRAMNVTSYMGVQVMDRVLPEDSVVGSQDAGVIGYFSRFPVVNLDGVVNSYGYLRAQKEGTEAAFHQRYGITRFANVWRLNLKEGTEAHVLPAIRGLIRQRLERLSVGGILFEGSPYFHYGKNVPHKRQFRLLTTEPPEMSSGGTNRSDWFQQRMEPHFDHRSDGVGLIVDGRMAQAFARDCAPDELALWSWVGQGDETAVNFWTQTQTFWTQTQTGLCVASLVLPHNALPPVRVEVKRPPPPDHPAPTWDVYLIENSLVYVKAPCARADTEAMFFLALYPVDGNDLPDRRKQHGFDNLDFDFDWRGTVLDRRCMARIPLPEYDIARISTGQYVPVEGGYHHLWEEDIRLEQ